MNAHDRLRIVFAEARQKWRAFAYVMHVHENHYTKRAGVAGLRARGFGVNRGFGASMSGGHGHFLGAGRARLRRGEALRLIVRRHVNEGQERAARR
ncbi:hypothetical protein [Enterobacter cloacae]|uniref:hypothetical protein n=1 Tax=Enterobacter cloacae TaxID=550 RepID=UPI001CC4083C|nr:hypothetical protein [Enterobacter cloacae]MBZ5212299.1 hypothetical protein [Enterobacter cloacae subsp. cloacae]